MKGGFISRLKEESFEISKRTSFLESWQTMFFKLHSLSWFTGLPVARCQLWRLEGTRIKCVESSPAPSRSESQATLQQTSENPNLASLTMWSAALNQCHIHHIQCHKWYLLAALLTTSWSQGSWCQMMTEVGDFGRVFKAWLLDSRWCWTQCWTQWQCRGFAKVSL